MFLLHLLKLYIHTGTILAVVSKSITVSASAHKPARRCMTKLFTKKILFTPNSICGKKYIDKLSVN